MINFLSTRSLRYALGFAIVGLFVTVLIMYVLRNILGTYERNLPYINLGDNIKNRSIKGHLWFEELMAGDNSIKFEENVLSLFISSRDILDGAYNSTNTELGNFEKLDDPLTYELIKEAIVGIKKLTEAARQRYNFKLATKTTVQTDSLGRL
jgi:hypothetical protein